ncbi:MAG TPA: ABC transporter ATP-binding protein [Acidimicrobiales bacterium]|nr:ABC transporter ATP-binding protein [Acidimicrobiales bacterium]
MRPLTAEGVTKSFRKGWGRRRKSTTAVDRVSFAVERGEIFGVIGSNGSGKSTLIRMISTLLLPDAGHVTIFGSDVVTDALAVRRLLNRVSADPSFFRNMSAIENLLFFGRVYGLDGDEIRRRVPEILARLHLEPDRAGEPMQHLSRGQQQKVAVARAFLTAPVLLLLDEPTTGLDPRSKRDVQGFVRDVRAEHDATILLTTHDMEEAEALCDRIAFLAGGRIVAEGSPLELRTLVAGERGVGVDDIDMEQVFLALTGRDLAEDEDEDDGDGDGDGPDHEGADLGLVAVGRRTAERDEGDEVTA